MTSRENIARVCHEVIRAYNEAIGDPPLKPWEEAPDWQRLSAMNGVRLHMNDPNAGPAASHESWMNEKLATGWVYGPTKDEEKKTHPCLVPFDALPVPQQAKDYIFAAIVHALGGK